MVRCLGYAPNYSEPLPIAGVQVDRTGQSQMMLRGFDAPESYWYLSRAMDRVGDYSSGITIFNPNASATTVAIHGFRSGGTGYWSQSVPAKGSWVIYVPNLTNSPGTDWQFRIVSDKDKPVVARTNVSYVGGDPSRVYQNCALQATRRGNISPRLVFPQVCSNSYGFNSGITLVNAWSQNVSNKSGTIRVRFYNASGTQVGSTVTLNNVYPTSAPQCIWVPSYVPGGNDVTAVAESDEVPLAGMADIHQDAGNGDTFHGCEAHNG